MSESQFHTIIGKPEFLAGGLAFFTVDNGKGEHFTFKISKPKNDDTDRAPLFASVLKGPDNWNNYKYIGIYNAGNIQWPVSLTKASKYPVQSVEYKTIVWAINHVRTGEQLPAGYSIQHAGKCCRCGRMLTNPASIEAGIGPTCAGLS